MCTWRNCRIVSVTATQGERALFREELTAHRDEIQFLARKVDVTEKSSTSWLQTNSKIRYKCLCKKVILFKEDDVRFRENDCLILLLEGLIQFNSDSSELGHFISNENSSIQFLLIFIAQIYHNDDLFNANFNICVKETKGAIDLKSEYLIRRRIRRNQAIDLIAPKLKSETVKPASKQVSRFRVLFTRPPVLTIDTSINCIMYLRKRVID